MSSVKIYTPDDYRKYRAFTNIRILFRNIAEYGTLIRRLTRVGLTQQYKRSFLGVAWLFISPVFSVFLWVVLKMTGILNPGDTGIPYIAYVFISNAIWNFFMGFYKSISETYTGRGRELLHNNFPHEIIIIEKILLQLINFSIPFALSLVVMMLFGIPITWSVLLFPVALIPFMILGIALGLLFSVLKIVALDFTTFFDNSLELLKYATPVVFAATVNNETLQTIMRYNPLTYLLDFPRSILLSQGFPNTALFFLCAAGSFLFLLFAYRFFSISSPVVFEKITV